MDHELTVQAGAAAFGDGNHPTTLGVLTALKAIDKQVFSPSVACDMGCGSGILSLAMARLFACPVLAVDIERTALIAVQENATSNGVAGILSLHSDGFAHPQIAAAAPFDLIVMNILAEPLLRLAASATAQLAPGGVLVMSGILRWQEAQIIHAYQELGLELASRIVIGDWVTLCWGKAD